LRYFKVATQANRRLCQILLPEVIAVVGLDDQVYLFAGCDVDFKVIDGIAILRRASVAGPHRVALHYDGLLLTAFAKP
jgi:hypothetical protein